jgi:hypothetical protein
MLKNILLSSFLLILLAGCSQKRDITFSLPYKVVIKTKDLAIADGGFLTKADNYKSLEVFSAGKIVLHVELNENACINNTCTNRLDFNKRVFGYSYYKNFLDDILDKKEIYGGKNIIKTNYGFTQNIKTKDFNIIYKVDEKSVYFKDKINHILLKLRRL